MAKYDPNHKPGPAATSKELPDGFEITGSIQSPARRTPFQAGDEAAYAETKPTKADVERLTELGAITLPAKAK